MEVILIEDVPNLGEIGDLVNVKPGFGRNFLIPHKVAIPASSKNKARLEHEKRLVSFRLQKAKALSAEAAKQVSSLTLVFARKVGEQDKLFGSVTSHDIAQALSEKGINIDRKKVVLPEPLKQLGDFKVGIKLRAAVTAEVKVQIVAET
ncbi:MAG: 50S ribosomal protein L9 [Deltaproteobacteria bacterium]|nr:50S ribosomal protein L9 [Deltaproteobacteria bacterium]